MCDYSAERPEFWRDETRAARKEHKCIECGDPISKGTRYKYVVGKQRLDHSLWEVKLCPQCDEDWAQLLRAEEEANPTIYWDSFICYGKLEERIQKALENRWIQDNHPLAKRWIPEDWLGEVIPVSI